LNVQKKKSIVVRPLDKFSNMKPPSSLIVTVLLQ